MSRSLIQDVSISELEQMRENGMTNQEIADAIGVSYQTIRKLIGRQPPGLRKPGVYHRPNFVQSEPKEEPPATLIVEDRALKLAGLYASYKIMVKNKLINVILDTSEGVSPAMEIPFDQIDTFIQELQAIQRHVKGMTIGNEMW